MLSHGASGYLTSPLYSYWPLIARKSTMSGYFDRLVKQVSSGNCCATGVRRDVRRSFKWTPSWSSSLLASNESKTGTSPKATLPRYMILLAHSNLEGASPKIWGIPHHSHPMSSSKPTASLRHSRASLADSVQESGHVLRTLCWLRVTNRRCDETAVVCHHAFV
jgi:hypothetical protein